MPNYCYGRVTGSSTLIAAEYEQCREKRDLLKGKIRELNKGGMKSHDTRDSSEETIAMQRDRWLPRATQQEA